MKIFSSLLVLLAGVAIPLVGCAATLNPALVPSDAQWVLYADLNGLRGSALGKELIALAEKAQLQANTIKIGVDIPKVLATVGTVTAYGTNFSHDPKDIDGTLIVQGTPDLRKIAESLLLQATIASPETTVESNDLPFPSYTVTAKHEGKPDVTPLIIAFPPEPIVLVSKSRAQLIRAHDAFLGKLPTVAKTATAPLKNLLRNSSDAFLFAASVVPSDVVFPENQPQARILKMTNSGAIAIGETGPNTFAHAQLVATSDQMADKLMKILQGLTAMLSLAETSDKQLAEFLSSATVARDDRMVTVDLSYSSERLAQMVRLLAQTSANRTADELTNARNAALISGEVISQWQAVATPDVQPAKPALQTHLIENVALKSGGIISLGQESNGGRNSRIDRIEITPVNGGTPLTFRIEFMRRGGPRGNLSQAQFPGADGVYNITVFYSNDPTGNAKYVVSVRQPRTAAPQPAPVTPAEAPVEKKS